MVTAGGAKAKAVMKIPQHHINHNRPYIINSRIFYVGVCAQDSVSSNWILQMSFFRKCYWTNSKEEWWGEVLWWSASGLERQVNHGGNPSPQWQSTDGGQTGNCDKTRRQKGNCLLCFIARLTLPRYLCSLIWSCGQFLVVSPLFTNLFLIALIQAFFSLTALCPICLISGSMIHICQGKSIPLFSSYSTSCSFKVWCMFKQSYNEHT